MNGAELRDQWENRNQDHDDDDRYEDPFDDGDEPCQHYHDEECYYDDDDRPAHCTHQHCMNCGQCGCAGYCDDHQTYNLRPTETGGDYCGCCGGYANQAPLGDHGDCCAEWHETAKEEA